MAATSKVEAVAGAICLGGSEVMPEDLRPDCETLCSLCLAEARGAIIAADKWDAGEGTKAPPVVYAHTAAGDFARVTSLPRTRKRLRLSRSTATTEF